MPVRSVHAQRQNLALLILGIGVLVAGVQAWLSHSVILNSSYKIDAGEPVSFEAPLRVSSAASGDFTVTFDLHAGHLRPTKYYILPDDCLQEITVNDRMITSPDIPFCDYVKGRTINLGPALHSGVNKITVVVRNNYGDLGLMIRPSFTDIVFLLPFAIILVGILGAFGVVLFLLRPPVWVTNVGAVLLGGIVLRTYYMMITPYWIRGHDTDGHLEYIRYIADNMSLPRPDLGWETWQPPLYYVLGGLWTALGRLLGMQQMDLIFGLQVWALLLSIASLFLFAWIGLRILPARQWNFLPLFVAVAAFLPSFVFQASRINNDVLVIFLQLLAIALFCEWRKRRTLTLWMGTWAAIGCAMLTKNTAILLIPPLLLTMLIEKPLKGWKIWKQKILLMASALLTVLLLAGWFTVYRKIQAGSQNLIIGNNDSLNSGLRVTNTVPHLLVFNPVAIVQHPYNNPWEDSARRQYFWEYLYRSAFFGEFNFGDARVYLASSLLFFSLFATLAAIIGLISSTLKSFRTSLFFLLLAGAILAGHLIFRMQFPFGSSQDFRYSLLFIVPFSYWLVLGVSSAKQQFFQRWLLVATEICLALCVLLVL